MCTAAVSDFKPVKQSKKKLKKNDINLKSLELTKNDDIVEYLGKNNKHRPRLVVAFSAETKFK